MKRPNEEEDTKLYDHTFDPFDEKNLIHNAVEDFNEGYSNTNQYQRAS